MLPDFDLLIYGVWDKMSDDREDMYVFPPRYCLRVEDYIYVFQITSDEDYAKYQEIFSAMHLDKDYLKHTAESFALMKEW